MEKGWSAADVTEPTEPAISHKESFGQFSFRYLAVEPERKILAITDSVSGLKYGYVRFYDLTSTPEAPKKVGQERLSEEYTGVPSRLALSDKYAYVANITVGLQVVDIDIAKQNITSGGMSSGEAIVGVMDTGQEINNQPWDIALYSSGKGLLTTSKGYLMTLDLSTPQAPQPFTSFQPSGYSASRVAATGGYTYLDADDSYQTIDLAVTAGAGKINTVDVSDPYNPKVMATAKNEQQQDVNALANEIAISKGAGLAFVATMNSVLIIDIKNPYNPRLLNEVTQLPTEGGVVIPLGANYGIVEKDGWLYLANDQQGLKVIQYVSRPIDILTIKPVEVNDSGLSVDQIAITYRVNDKNFQILSAVVNIYKDGTKIITLPSGVEHLATVTIPYLQQLDINARYHAEVVLNGSSADALTSYRKRIPLFIFKVTVDSANALTLDLDAKTTTALTVNYNISPSHYQAANAKVILVEDGTEINSASGATSGTGSVVFPAGMTLDPDKKYEVYVELDSPVNTKQSQRKIVNVTWTASCKKNVGGQLVNLPDGSRSLDGDSCCYQGEMQQNHPIANLDNCPSRIKNPLHVPAFNGCGGEGLSENVPDNPMLVGHLNDPIYIIKHGSSDHGNFTASCNGHDTCYDTCNTYKPFCDITFGDSMRAVCEKDYSAVYDTEYLIDCYGYAVLYEAAVTAIPSFYRSAQQEACNCCY